MDHSLLILWQILGDYEVHEVKPPMPFSKSLELHLAG